jgi:hypothetical protein
MKFDSNAQDELQIIYRVHHQLKIDHDVIIFWYTKHFDFCILTLDLGFDFFLISKCEH